MNIQYFKQPNVDLEPINKIKIELPSMPRINEPDLNKYQNNIFKSKATLEEYEGPAKMNDVVTFDFEGKVNNKPFKDGSSKDFKLELGSKRFIKGFEEELVG